jgi:hypothetical protein
VVENLRRRAKIGDKVQILQWDDQIAFFAEWYRYAVDF